MAHPTINCYSKQLSRLRDPEFCLLLRREIPEPIMTWRRFTRHPMIRAKIRRLRAERPESTLTAVLQSPLSTASATSPVSRISDERQWISALQATRSFQQSRRTATIFSVVPHRRHRTSLELISQ